MNRLTFSKVFWIWFIFDLVMMFVNGATIQSSLLASFCHALLGIFLLIFPVYPKNFSLHWDDAKSKQIIRIIAALEILWSFFLKINF